MNYSSKPAGALGAGTSAASPPPTSLTFWLVVVIVVVLLSGGLFGYDQGVISGALNGIRATFSLSPFILEVVTSGVTLGALFGALAAGEMADRIGRERTVTAAAVMFVVGALVQGLAPDTAVLVVGRMIVGIGVGVAAVAAPLYAAEMAPAGVRGRFISLYQLAITVGIFVAYLTNGWLSKSASGGTWRLMLGAALIPGALLLIASVVAPKSPRWLMMKSRRQEAAAELLKVQPGSDTGPPLDAIEAVLRDEGAKASWGEVFQPRWRRPLLIALGLAVFQQITGINAIIYYASQIFASAGFTTESSQAVVTTWAIGGVNVLATLIAVAYIDRVGRRRMLIVGLAGMTVSLAVVGAAFRFLPTATAAVPPADGSPSTAGILTICALVCFIICFAFSMGPVVWTVINEVFPAHIRGRAVAVATAANWGSAYLVSQFFLTLVGQIGSSMTFWLFALFSVIAGIWIYVSVPETKGRSLEEIQDLWKSQA